MANFFSLQNGSLTDISTYGYSLTSAEIMNNTTGTMLLTSNNLYSANGFSDGSTLSAIAVHLSARAANPTGTLGLTLQRTASGNVFLDSSSNNLAITTVGSAYQNTFSPFSPNGWSGYFNGSTSYLLVSSNPALAIGTGDFTLECWVYRNASNTYSNVLEINSHGVNTGVGFFIETGGNSIPLVYSGAAFAPTNVPTLSSNKWTHIAYVRQAGNLKIYVDGIGSSSVAFGNNISTVTNFSIGYVAGQNGGSAYYYNGHISNFRLIKGQAIYTTNFTPPTAAFGLTDNGGAIGATTTPLASSVSILTLQNNTFKDNSNNNFALTAVGSPIPYIKDVSPFTPVTINPAVHGGSVLFAGNTYNTITSQPSLSFGTGDFTVDCWIYPRSNISQYEAICAGADVSAFSLQTQVANDNKICITTTTAQILAGTIPLSLNQWNHVAATRSSGKLLLYVNGLSSAQKIGDTTNFTQITFIGGGTGGSNVNIIKNSYISNFRAVKGTALYTTASFAPSTSLLTNIAGTSLLLNTNNYGLQTSATETYAISGFTSFDGSNNLLTRHPQNWQILKLTNPLSTNRGDFINYTLSTSNPNQLSLMGAATATDTTGINRLATVGSPLLTSFKPYTNFDDSYYLNGTTDWFTVPANPRFALDGDFTIECWINTSVFNPYDNTVSRRIFSFGVDASNAMSLTFFNGVSASSLLSLNAGGLVVTGTRPVADGSWHHVAVSRYNNAMRLYVDGNQSGSTTTNTTNYNAGSTNTLTIGAYNNTTQGRLSAAYINNFRIVNGTAVYTTSSFSPPTTPLTVIPNTVFLMKNGVRYNQAVLTTNTYADASTATMTNTNAVLSTASPFGTFNGGSISFNGTSSFLRLPTNTNLTLGGDFTIDFWANTNPTGVTQTFFQSNWDGTVRGVAMWNHASYANRFSFWVTNYSASIPILSSTTIMNSNTWYHVAVTRSGNDWRLFVNGNVEHTRTAASTIEQQIINIGKYDAADLTYLNGCIANLRIIKGTCLYTSNFSLPKGPPLLVTGTSLLFNNPHSLTNYLFSNNTPTNHYIGSSLKGLNRESCTIIAEEYTLNNLYIHNQGTLTFPLTSNTTLTLVGSAGLQITSDGTLNIGTSSSSIPLSTTHTITLSNTQIDVHNGGNFNVYGFPETTTTSLVSTHPIGSRTFTVTSTVSNNWRVGDILAFKPNLSARTSFDTLVLSSFVAPNVFTTTSSSLCTHTGSADQFSFIPDVYNLSRNVNIQGLNITSRGTIRTIDAAKTYLNYVTLSNFGINSSNKTGLVIGNNSNGSTTLSGIVINSDNTTTVNNIAPLTGRTFQNAGIYNSIINRSNVVALTSLSVNNVNISNNYILSSGGTGLQMNNLSGSINMSNNTTIGSLSVGTNLFNNSLTGTYGALNYNSALQGMIVSETNTGTITGGSINSAREGVYVDASTNNLSGLTFRNIIASNNSSVGFEVFGNNLNYLTPIILNVNGLTANSNLDHGFEAYNITGNLSSLIITNNMNTNIRTSIGNGPTTFNGLTSLANNSPTISSGITLFTTPTGIVSSLSAPSYFGNNEGSLYFTGSAYAELPVRLNIDGTFTIEGWIYIQAYPTSGFLPLIGFSYDSNNRSTAFNRVFSIDSAGRLKYYNYNLGDLSVTTTSSISLSTWTHFAFCVTGNTVRFYMNGVDVTPASNSYVATGTIITSIGAIFAVENTTKFFISNYRISNIVRYPSGGFTPITTAISNADANTLLLYKNPYNNTFLTSSVNTNNLNVNILSGYNYSRIYIKNASIGKLDTYPSLYPQLIMDSTRFSNFSLENSVVTGGGLINPIQLNTTRNLIEGSYLFNNTNLGSINFIDLTKYQPSVTRTTGFGFTNYNKIAGNHFTYLPMGVKAVDTSLYDTSTSDLISERLTPTSRTIKLCSGTKYVALNSGETTLVKVNILVSSSYTGNLPRLMLRRNAAAGVYSDTVLSVFNPNLGYNTFIQLIGVQTPAVIDNAVLEFYVDCDGTTGYVCVDTWTAN
jgi:hypothetical protein